MNVFQAIELRQEKSLEFLASSQNHRYTDYRLEAHIAASFEIGHGIGTDAGTRGYVALRQLQREPLRAKPRTKEGDDFVGLAET
ncbi:hypothetical protein WS65_14295 [Burkholderia anthina]|nr:hypothetical protein WS65_14295 [Burkholderia anthina]KWH62564.1 hypothetical protein WT63_14230 [Burkholderia anthina]